VARRCDAGSALQGAPSCGKKRMRLYYSVGAHELDSAPGHTALRRVMPPDEIPDLLEVPDDVRALLRERIESYEQLEMLFALRNDRREQSPAEMSARFGIDRTLAASALAELQTHGLAQSRGRDPERYRYAPASPALDQAVGHLARLYIEQPIGVLKILTANAIRRVRTGALRAFAEAFILRKDEDRG
jgi:hypothetical protein